MQTNTDFPTARRVSRLSPLDSGRAIGVGGGAPRSQTWAGWDTVSWSVFYQHQLRTGEEASFQKAGTVHSGAGEEAERVAAGAGAGTSISS